MVAVRVGEGDAEDGLAEFLRGGEDARAGAGNQRVDQRQPVLLLDEVGVDEQAPDAMDLGKGCHRTEL